MIADRERKTVREDWMPKRTAMPVQLRFATNLTSEQYVSQQAWRRASRGAAGAPRLRGMGGSCQAAAVRPIVVGIALAACACACATRDVPSGGLPDAFVPLGMTPVKTGACYRTMLSCRERGELEHFEWARFELVYVWYDEGQPTGASHWPPPPTPDTGMLYWFRHAVRDRAFVSRSDDHASDHGGEVLAAIEHVEQRGRPHVRFVNMKAAGSRQSGRPLVLDVATELSDTPYGLGYAAQIHAGYHKHLASHPRRPGMTERPLELVCLPLPSQPSRARSWIYGEGEACP